MVFDDPRLFLTAGRLLNGLCMREALSTTVLLLLLLLLIINFALTCAACLLGMGKLIGRCALTIKRGGASSAHYSNERSKVNSHARAESAFFFLERDMNAVVALCHFCEAHGPGILFCTQVSPIGKEAASLLERTKVATAFLLSLSLFLVVSQCSRCAADDGRRSSGQTDTPSGPVGQTPSSLFSLHYLPPPSLYLSLPRQSRQQSFRRLLRVLSDPGAARQVGAVRGVSLHPRGRGGVRLLRHEG